MKGMEQELSSTSSTVKQRRKSLEEGSIKLTNKIIISFLSKKPKTSDENQCLQVPDAGMLSNKA